MNCVALAVDKFGGKQWGCELLGEPIQRGLQVIGLDIKEVVGIAKGGKGIMTAAVAFDELLIFAGLRILFGSQEQHVLQKMCDTFALFRIIPTANADVHGGSGFVCVLIGYQNRS